MAESKAPPPRQRPPHYVAEWRKSRGWSQERLAAMVNVDRSTISRVENGDTALTQEFLERLSLAFGVPARALVEVNPSQPGGDEFAVLMRSWQRLPAHRRAEILRIIAALDPPESE